MQSKGCNIPVPANPRVRTVRLTVHDTADRHPLVEELARLQLALPALDHLVRYCSTTSSYP